MKLYIGTMTGTSLDAIDCAVFADEHNKLSLIAHHSLPYPQTLRNKVLTLAENKPTTIREVGQIDNELGECYAEAILALLAKANLKAKDIAAIGNHGQTVWHEPTGPNRFSTQLGNPNIIAAKTSISVVADFRRMDMAYGGQGAPLAPAFHAAIFGSIEENRGILNLGGIANISILNKKELVAGFDIGPSNMLMDAWTQENLHKPYDENGDWARSGRVHHELLNELLNESFFSKAPPKSTGRELFNLTWLKQKLKKFTNITANDVEATLCELTAQTVAEAIDQFSTIKLDALYICGGGAHNHYLLERLGELSNLKIASTQTLGIDPEWVECGIFAWLAKMRLENIALDLKHVTGCFMLTHLGGLYNYPQF